MNISSTEFYAKVEDEKREQYIVPVKNIKKFKVEEWNKNQSELKLKYFKVKIPIVNSEGEEIIEKRKAVVLKISGNYLQYFIRVLFSSVFYYYHIFYSIIIF